MKKNLIKALQNLKKFCDDGFEYSIKILSESDLKCFLYSEIIKLDKNIQDKKVNAFNCNKENIYDYIKDDTSNGRATLITTEFSYSREIKVKNKFVLKNQECDLVLLDEDEVNLYYTKNGLFKYVLEDISNHSVFLELKYSCGKSKKYILEKMQNDLNKFNNDNAKYSIKRSYVFYYDQEGKLKDEDLNDIEVGNSKLIYYDNKNKKFLKKNITIS